MTRTTFVLVLAIVLLAAGPSGAVAQNVMPGLNGYVTLATGYWSRGLSQNDDGLVLQAGIDYQHRSGVFVGGRAADVDYRSSDPQSRELEFDVYLGFHRRHPAWSWTLTYAHYAYPDVGDRYDYRELAASVGFRDRVFFTTAYTDDFFSTRRAALSSELALTFPLPWNLEISTAVGRFDVDVSSTSEFTHWNIGVSKVARRLVFDVRYYDSDYDVLTPLGDPTSDNVVLSVSYALGSARPRI